MADYKELLRRAISALPENNGAARRAVYEKARSALVGQLRAITPPLPARDITQHRLQLEDCIRQVEQEASEAVITLGRDQGLMPRQSAPPPPAPAPVPEPVAPAAVEPEPPVVAKPAKPVAAAEAIDQTVAETPAPAEVADAAPAPGVVSIEDIISQAANNSGASVTAVKSPPTVEHFSGVSRRESTKTEPTPDPTVSNVRAFDKPLNEPKFEPRHDIRPVPANSSAALRKPDSSLERVVGAPIGAPQTAAVVALTPTPVDPALSAVREVELEAKAPDTSEAEGAIERAIETLDREARGEPAAVSPETAQQEADRAFAVPDRDEHPHADDGDEAIVERRAGSGLTIFLVVFAILLAGAGGTGFWAWREGYVDLDQMFGNAPSVAEAPAIAVDPGTPTMDPVQQPIIVEPNTDVVGTPGNTSTATPVEPTQTLEGVEDRLEPSPEPVVATGNEVRLPALGTGEVKSEERLPGEERLPSEEATATGGNDLAASVDPAVLAGSQSLLLEASTDGRTGAVPFSGTVDWTEGTDELGEPTLIGRANIPARNLGVRLTIRKNSDPSLPASHLMEVDFDVNDTFIGGTIANLPGVLLKNEELVPGTPLVGASARVVGNSFLFALSASPNDTSTNTNLLENRKWMDLAVVYGTGRNAIITLEKDDTAQALFAKVFGAWKT